MWGAEGDGGVAGFFDSGKLHLSLSLSEKSIFLSISISFSYFCFYLYIYFLNEKRERNSFWGCRLFLFSKSQLVFRPGKELFRLPIDIFSFFFLLFIFSLFFFFFFFFFSFSSLDHQISCISISLRACACVCVCVCERARMSMCKKHSTLIKLYPLFVHFDSVILKEIETHSHRKRERREIYKLARRNWKK